MWRLLNLPHMNKFSRISSPHPQPPTSSVLLNSCLRSLTQHISVRKPGMINIVSSILIKNKGINFVKSDKFRWQFQTAQISISKANKHNHQLQRRKENSWMSQLSRAFLKAYHLSLLSVKIENNSKSSIGAIASKTEMIPKGIVTKTIQLLDNEISKNKF